MLHDEVDHVAALAAGKAFAQLLGGGDDETGCFLLVEGAQSLIVHAGFAQCDKILDHVDNVGGVEYAGYGGLINHAALLNLAVKDKLERNAKVLGGGGVGAAGQQGLVELAVVESRKGEVFAQCIVGRETYLHGFVTAGGLCQFGQYVAVECALVANAEVQTQVEVIAKSSVGFGTLTSAARFVRFARVFGFALAAYGFLGRKEVEVVYLVP